MTSVNHSFDHLLREGMTSSSGSSMLPRVLIANRGEIALRVARSARRCGMDPVSLHTSEDSSDPHVRSCTESVVVPSYLDAAAVVDAAKRAHCQFIHPGYGFLSESADFARLVQKNGLTWVGPSPSAMELMADKRAALRSVAGVAPVLPGCEDDTTSPEGRALTMEERDAKLMDAVVTRVGFPAIVKPAAGGGGKGMSVAHNAAELRTALQAARRAAVNSFGDASASLLVERFVENARHIEVQIFGDKFGNVVHLGDRDCSVQRRRQKIVEEAPASGLPASTRKKLAETAVRIAKATKYVGAGTVEFLVDSREPEKFWFLEMNARLQVEHPVTEAVTGIDLVQWQLDVACGKPLPCTDQNALMPSGFAIEARLCAEDPERDYAPSAGRITHLRLPRESKDVRVDSGVVAGGEVSVLYDPLIAKIICRGRDRDEARRRMAAALTECQVAGVRTNLMLLRRLVGDPRSPLVQGGFATTTMLESPAGEPLVKNSTSTPADGDDDVVLASALAAAQTVASAQKNKIKGIRPNWRLSGEEVECPLTFRDLGKKQTRKASFSWDPEKPCTLNIAVDGKQKRKVPVDVRFNADDPECFSLCVGGRMLNNVRVVMNTPASAEVFTPDAHYRAELLSQEQYAQQLQQQQKQKQAGGSSDMTVEAPLTARVTKILVEKGSKVTAGQTLAILEAMKMEHTVAAPKSGIVSEVACKPGAQVHQNEQLFIVH